jgi:hypothetical protein
MSAQLHVSADGYTVFTIKTSDGRTVRICGPQAMRGPVRDAVMRELAADCQRAQRFERLQDGPRVRRGRAA